MTIKAKYLERAAYIWIYSSVVLFLFGFLKWYIAIPSVAGVCAAMFFVFRKQNDDTFTISPWAIASGAVIVLVWMAFCGQGGFFQQAADWMGRNAQLGDLISYSWPVYYSDGSAFSYYIGHFLVPAAFGKLFGLGFARTVLMLYTSFGVFLTWLYLVKILKLTGAVKPLLILLIFVFFGDMELLRNIMTNLFVGIFNIHQDGIPYGFTTNANSYAWAFNQVTCAFLVLSMFFDSEEKLENYFVMGVPLMLFSPFMMLGTVVYFAVGAVRQFLNNKKIKDFLIRLFSIQNICVLVFVAACVFLYLEGNIFSKKPDQLTFQAVSYGNGRIIMYILFVLFEFIPFSALIFTSNKRNPYFYAANAILIILPFFKMGLYNDLVSRGSAAGLFVIMLLVGDYLLNRKSSGAVSVKITKIALVCLLATVAIPTANSYLEATKGLSAEIAEHSYHEKWAESYSTYDNLYKRTNNEDLKYNYYTYNAKEHFFFKYIARN